MQTATFWSIPFMNCEKKLKICHVITRMVVGGAQENTLFTALDHAEKDHDVTLVTGFSPGREGELLQKAKLNSKLRIVETPTLCPELSLKNDPKAYCFLKRFFKENNFDVVHTHSSKAGIIGRIAAWNAKVPFVVHTVHGQAFHPFEKAWKNFIYKTAERYAAKQCHKIYAVAQAMINQCIEAKIAPAEKYMVVYSGMEIGDFLNAKKSPELCQKLQIPSNAPVIGSIARLFPLKGYEYFIPAAHALLQKRPDVHFLLVGDGSMHDELIEQVKKLGIEKNIHFAGLVAPYEVPLYVGNMDLLWHFSVREGLPRSVVQALAAGKIPMSFALDGAPEVILNDLSGYTLPYRDDMDDVISEIAEKSEYLLNNPDVYKKMSDYGRELVREKFDHHYMADVLEKEYLSGIDGAK